MVSCKEEAMRKKGIITLAILTILSAIGLMTGRLQADAAEEVRWTVEIELTKGHLVSSVEAYRVGKVSLAKTHASHPVSEHYAKLLKTPLKKRAPRLEQELTQALHGLSDEIRPKGEIAAYEVKIQETFVLLDRALEILVSPNVREEVAFQGEVLSRLLKKIGEEYGEAVEGGKVINLPEYQDAFGFLQRAKALFQALKLRLRVEATTQKELDQLFARLEEALPAIIPLADLPPSTTLKGWIATFASLIEKATGR